jgi:hypothetical protein
MPKPIFAADAAALRLLLLLLSCCPVSAAAAAAVAAALCLLSGADTPAGEQLQQASAELQGDYSNMFNILQAAAAAGADAGEGSIEDSSQHQQQQQQVLQMIESNPHEAFRMFGWAQQLVHQGAICLQQQQQQQQQMHQGRSLVLVPGLEHMPKVGSVDLLAAP